MLEAFGEAGVRTVVLKLGSRGAALLWNGRVIVGEPLPAASRHRNSLRRAERDLAFTEVLAIASALKIDAETLRTLAETFERAGAAATQTKRDQLSRDLNDLQRVAVEAAIEARALA